MTRSFAFAALLTLALAGCAQRSAEPLPAVAADSVALNFVPYCGPVWSVERQGYLHIPCPPGINYTR